MLFRLINTAIMLVIIIGGGYFYLKYNQEAKQKLFSTVTSTMQDACQNINNSAVDLSEMNFRGIDLGAMASTLFSGGSLEDKQAALQDMGQQIAFDNKDLIISKLKDQGMSDSKVNEALDFQEILQQRNIPIQLGPFLFVIKDSAMAEQYFEGLSKENVGVNGAGAIDLLKKALDGDNAALKEAAKQSLMLIGTPEARAATQATKGN